MLVLIVAALHRVVRGVQPHVASGYGYIERSTSYGVFVYRTADMKTVSISASLTFRNVPFLLRSAGRLPERYHEQFTIA